MPISLHLSKTSSVDAASTIQTRWLDSPKQNTASLLRETRRWPWRSYAPVVKTHVVFDDFANWRYGIAGQERSGFIGLQIRRLLAFPDKVLRKGVAAYAQRHAQLFGAGTTNRLRRMAAAVIGCSGTGSPLIEQLARLGFGRLVLVDPDFIEERNLNRIVNAWREHA